MAVGYQLTWSSTSTNLGVGETIQAATYNYGPNIDTINTLLGGIATATDAAGYIELTGVSAGTVSIPAGTSVGGAGGNVTTSNATTITVTSAEDESYLNKRGLAHFWENIDDLKQDTLTAGTGISISNNVISATGGGEADSVAWGHITGTLADQTDLQDELDAKVDTADLATVATSGSYDDLTDKPTIGTGVLTISKNSTAVDTFSANATANKTIDIAVPTTAAEVSALSDSTKYAASLTASINTTTYVMTLTLKDQDGNTLGTAQTIDLPLESVVVNGSYDSTNKKIVLTLQSGSTIDIPVADLIAGLQSEITSTNMLDADLVDDSTSTHKFTTASDITKLAGIESGAEVNVQSDWDQTDSTADDFIKNKPTSLSDFTNDPGYITSFTDTQVTQTRVDPSATTTFYPVASTSSTTNTGDVKKFNGVKLNYASDDGGVAELELGQNSYYDPVYGALTLWSGGTNQYKTTLRRRSSSATDQTNQTFYFPYNADATYGTLVANGTSNTATGSATNPVYADADGILHATTYSLNKTVPSDAVFTDTTYSDATTSASGLMSASDKTKLNGIASGAEVNVQSDWSQTDNTADDYIKNKPDLATVATSGSYTDLSDKPTIGNATITIQKNGSSAGTFTTNATSNKSINITVPTATSDLTNDSGFLTSYTETDPIYSASAAAGITSTDITNWNNKSDFSGSYTDLTDKPTIGDATLTIQKNGTTVQTFTANATSAKTANITVPTKTSDLTNDSGYITDAGVTSFNGSTGAVTYTAPVTSVNGSTGAVTVSVPTATSDLTNDSGFITSDDLPTVNDATLTIQQNGTDVATFTANSSTDATANITVPTATSDLSNDSGFVSTSDTGTVSTAMIADEAVTSDKIDWSTLAPYWKVVSVVSGTNAWTIPAGYRFYRLVMRCSTSAPSTASRPAIASSSKSGTAWSTWVSEDSGTATAGAGSWNSSSATLTVVAPNANTTACSPVVKLDLTRLDSGGTAFVGTWTCSGSGFDWVSVGKVEFPVSDGSSDFYLYFIRNNSSLSSFLGYVEALVEE